MAKQRNDTANGASGGYKIDFQRFKRRLKVFFSSWKDHKQDLWGGSDVLAISTPPPSDDLRYLKSTTLNVWLLGYEFPETIMVFMQKQIHFLCTQKKASLLDTVKGSAKEAVGVDVVIHVKAKNGDGGSQMETIFEAARDQCKSKSFGYIAKETPEGKLLEKWNEKLKGSMFDLKDITNGFSELFAVKDESELSNIKNAALLSASVLKNFVAAKLEDIIDEEKKVAHSTLMEDTEIAILDPIKAKVNLKADNVDICYQPIFQSGGEFDLMPTALSNDDHLYYDAASVIICAIGSRYNSYCSNVARTFLIDSIAVQIKAYEVLLQAHAAVISSLKPGNKVGAAYQAAVDLVLQEAPEFATHLTRSAGAGIGIEFRESGLSLNAMNDRILKAGMVFNVSLGFQNLHAQTNNPKTEKFSLLLADTVVVGDKLPEVATSICSKAVENVAYSFNEEDNEPVHRKPETENATDSSVPKTILRSDYQGMNKEEMRRHHQAELGRQKNEETARRLAGGGTTNGGGRGSTKASSDLVAYKNVNEIPPVSELMIRVDQRNEAVLLPICGIMIPFHIKTVKNVTSQQDGNGTGYIRIIFNAPGLGFVPQDANSKSQGSIYLKEVSFHSKDPRHIIEVVQLIKTLRRQVSSRESEKAERATLVTQEKLQLSSKFKSTRLFDLWIRPVFGGRGRKKLKGTLECHANGFRFSTKRQDERVDILFRNIKHAFFQPAETEMITLLHFHLHNHIMVGNKKSKDVQFFVEVMDVAQTLGGGRRTAYDPDEIEEEQSERERKNRINMGFQNFVNKANDLWEQPRFKCLDLEFDQPLRKLGFHGVPHKASTFIVPTSDCLVELIEMPFLVITLNEVEIVNLERVGFGQKTFDMAVVFKDFKRDVLRIDSIRSTSLGGIKEWLDTTAIKYYESRLNLNWKPILKTITDDPEKFVEDGGWEFLNIDISDSDSDNTEESDQAYEPSDVESESVSEDDDSYSESLVKSDEDEEEEDDSEEEEGKSWDELEVEARNACKEKDNEPDNKEDRKRRKLKAFGKARMPDKRDGKGLPPKKPKLR